MIISEIGIVTTSRSGQVVVLGNSMSASFSFGDFSYAFMASWDELFQKAAETAPGVEEFYADYGAARSRWI